MLSQRLSKPTPNFALLKDNLVARNFTYLPYRDTGKFSHIVEDYLDAADNIQPFYTYAPDANGIAAAINERDKYPVDRKVLFDTLTKQYAGLQKHENVDKNLQLLLNNNTYTVCTAHQPNLLTGYLYFVYKILHAIKMAAGLQQLHPNKHFVPVYYMGSEDNDLEELGTFRYGGNKYVWDGNGQTGAVGRMKTAGLKTMLNDLFKLFGPPGNDSEQLKEIITRAYLQHDTIGAATQYLVNELFGRYGLIVLDPDEAAFKKAIIPVIKDDLLHQTAYTIVTEQIEKLSVHYKAQAYPRPVNLFYLIDSVRERIEKIGDEWHVVNTDIKWNEKELLEELNTHPERFSPNVILRGILQESILPDVAFIGGGSEVAYWMQLQTLFSHYKVFYPVIYLRQSVLWIPSKYTKLHQQLGLDIPHIFEAEVLLVRNYIAKHSGNEWQVNEEAAQIENILKQLKQKAIAVDPTLKASSEAALTKMKYQLQVLEKKMLRAEKRKLQTEVLKISRLKDALFPRNGLQERVENFSEYFMQYGAAFFDTIYEGILPFDNRFLIIEDNI